MSALLQQRNYPLHGKAFEVENALLNAEFCPTPQTHELMKAEILYFQRESAKSAVEATEARNTMRKAEKKLASQAKLIAQLEEENHRLRNALESDTFRGTREEEQARKFWESDTLQQDSGVIASNSQKQVARGISLHCEDELERTVKEQQARIIALQEELASLKCQAVEEQFSSSSRAQRLEAENKKLRHAQEKLAQENAAFRSVLAKKTADRLFGNEPNFKDCVGDNLPAMSRAIKRYRHRQARSRSISPSGAPEGLDVRAEQLMEENMALILYIRRVLTRMAGFTTQDILTPRASMDSLGTVISNAETRTVTVMPAARKFAANGSSPRPSSPLAARSGSSSVQGPVGQKISSNRGDGHVSIRSSIASSLTSSAPQEEVRKRASGVSPELDASPSSMAGDAASSSPAVRLAQRSSMDYTKRRRSSSTGAFRRAFSRVNFWSACTSQSSPERVRTVKAHNEKKQNMFESFQV